jgi:carbon monoxide dehydrogenase subunit G
MQMTAQQRISASRQRVWEALQDPEVLRRCIPGCQTLTKESDERMTATVSIKIGPIGARFTGWVTLSDINAPNSYTMTMEGQGGTVGSVKAIVKVQLADDAVGGTLLSYDVDAQLGGRLVQLGGPIIDATSKQMVGKFFKEFGAIVGQAGDAAGADAAMSSAGAAGSAGTAAAAGATGAMGASGAMGATASAPGASQAAAHHAAAYAPRARGTPVAWVLALILAGIVGYLIGHTQRGGESDWMGLAIGLLLLLVGAAGFEYGRRSAAPVVTLDAALLARLLGETKR